MFPTSTFKVINIFCLVAAIAIVLLLPAKKEVWYDETVSILCSHGFSSDDPARLAGATSVSSAALERMNTVKNVFDATVTDNANSFIYNICLHWFTMIFGNTITAYMLLSKLCAIITLLAFFVLSSRFFVSGAFAGLAVVLLALDINFIGMSHEIRAYSMATAFACFAGLFFFRYVNEACKTRYLLLTGLCSVAAVLTHFLSVYIVMVVCFSILLVYRQQLITFKNILAISVPILLAVLFFYFAWPGLQIMSRQNQEIQAHRSIVYFDLWVVIIGTLRFIALNFKMVFPAFIGKQPVVIVSFACVIALYIAAWKYAADAIVRRNLHLLFALGVSSSVFLALLCIKSGHYTSLYYRYHSFAIPFSTLFTVYAIYVLYGSGQINRMIKPAMIAGVLVPVVFLFAKGALSANPQVKYNHFAIAKRLIEADVDTITVPGWRDAFLIQCSLPGNYKIDYVRNENAPYFTFRTGSGEQKIPVIAKEN